MLSDLIRDDLQCSSSLTENFKVILDHMRDRWIEEIGEFPDDKVERPSAALSLIRFNEDSLDYFVLGDTVCVFWYEDGSFKEIRDDSVSKMDKKVAERIKQLQKEEGLTHEEALNSVNNKLSAQWKEQ